MQIHFSDGNTVVEEITLNPAGLATTITLYEETAYLYTSVPDQTLLITDQLSSVLPVPPAPPPLLSCYVSAGCGSEGGIVRFDPSCLV